MTEKGKAILAYVFGWIGGLVVLYGVKDNERNTKMHAAQAIVMGLANFIITFIYGRLPIYIPFFSFAIWAIYIVGVVIGIVKAYNEEEPEIPVVGEIAKSIFGKKIDE